MKILLLSEEGDGLGIAQQLRREGNSVKVYVKDKRFKLAGVGIIDRVTSWRPYLTWADFIVCDMVGFGKYEDTFKRLGKVVFSCSRVADLLELDRGKGIELFENAGIQIPETYKFSSPREAEGIASLWESPGFVIKPSGNLNTASTYVCESAEIYNWALSKIPADTPLIVQKIVKGIEVSTEGWFNGRDWITPFNHTFEEKRLFSGDNGGKGPNTGCMGNVVITTERNKLVDSTLLRITPFLKRIGYRGPLDINCIVSDSDMYALEVTARLGYDAIEALMEGLKEPVTDLLFETAMGVKKRIEVTEDYMIAVRLSVPPWPHDEPDSESDVGLPIIGLNENNLKHIFLTDVFKDGDDYLSAAGDGVLMKVTARGRDVKEAQNRVYRTIGNLTILDVQYRDDIGNRVVDDINKLKQWGWL